MLRNYLTVAFRNLLQNKGYAGLNIVGLAFGLAGSLLIMLWVQDEWNYDRFHANAEKLYRVRARVSNMEAAITSQRMAPALPAELPAVKAAARVKEAQELVRAGNRKFEEKRVYYADNSFLSMFSFPLVQGDPQTALLRPDGLAITEATARKYFGTTDAVGKTLQLLDREADVWKELTVTGVLKNIPHQSHLQFDLLLPFARRYGTGNFARNDAWDSFSVFTYLQLHDQAAGVPGIGAQVAAQIDALHRKQESAVEAQFILQPLTDIHLRTPPGTVQDVEGHGNLAYVRAFFGVAVVILLIACINFMNLATARSVQRAKEVGVRKSVGASRGSLITQFVSEAVGLSVLATGMALLCVELLLPAFNGMTDKRLAVPYGNPAFLLLLGSIALLTGLVSGSYPALLLSSFRPVQVLKGTIRVGPGATQLRQGLVVFQFVLSMMMIVATLVVYQQIQFIRSKDIGLQRENVIYVPQAAGIEDHYEAYRADLLNQPGVRDVTRSNFSPLAIHNTTTTVAWPGKSPEEIMSFQTLWVDYGFVPIMGMQLLDGRDFSRAFATDSAGYIINEEAARRMGMRNPVGQRMKLYGREGTVIGLLKNFHSTSLHSAVSPLVMALWPDNCNLVMVRTEAGKTAGVLAGLEKLHRRYAPADLFEYTFLDEDFEQMYRGDVMVGKLANGFAFIAIFISCLGLFGLATFTAEKRTREIGIRKVLGASVSSLVGLLSMDFVRLVLLAVLVASPLAWYVMDEWLANFEYRTPLNWRVFALAGGAALLVALLTVSFQAVKAALVNPATSLRSE